MGFSVDIPGRGALHLDHLVLDVNGTLADRGVVLPGVAERIASLRESLDIRILSADTFGTLDEVIAELGVHARRAGSGDEKARVVGELGPDRCVAIGNGANDAPMLELAALGVAVIGPEGGARSAVTAADVVCVSILDALDLLLDPRALVATLRP